MGMDTGLTLHFKPSRQLVLFYVLLAVVCATGIFALPFTAWIKLSLGLLVLGLIIYVVQQHAFLSLQSSIVSLIYLPHAAQAHRWKVITKAGLSHYVILRLQDCYVSPVLTVLNVQQTARQSWFSRFVNQRTIIILPDRLPIDEYRRLRVLLNWANHRDEASPV